MNIVIMVNTFFFYFLSSNPLFYSIPENPSRYFSLCPPLRSGPRARCSGFCVLRSLWLLLVCASVSAPQEGVHEWPIFRALPRLKVSLFCPTLTWHGYLFHIELWTESIFLAGIWRHSSSSGLRACFSQVPQCYGSRAFACGSFFLSAVPWNLRLCCAEHLVALFSLKGVFFSYRYLLTMSLVISYLLLFLVSLELLPEVGPLKSPISSPT